MVTGNDLRQRLGQIPSRQNVAAQHRVIEAQPLHFPLVRGIGGQVLVDRCGVIVVAGLDHQQLANVVQQAGEQHLGRNHAEAHAEGQLPRHRRGPGRMVADPHTNPAQILDAKLYSLYCKEYGG